MSYTLKLFIGLLALLALPALSACDTGRGPGEDMEASRGTDTMGEEGPAGEGVSGTREDDEEGTTQ